MAIKEMQLHGVTSIKVQQTNSMQESFGVCTRRIRFETSDGTSLTVIAFAHDSNSLDLIHKRCMFKRNDKALEGENQC